ncbi:MAG: MraY family glycosyltransferase [bacterium]|nr:MraY family glycosyltransferase [bacterium]
MPDHVLGLLIAAAAALSVTPVVKRLAVRVGAFDQPVPRSVHTRAVPHLGGLAIYIAFAAGALATAGPANRDVRAILLGGLLVLALGALDDFRNLRPAWKLLGQIVAAGVVVSLGCQIRFFSHPVGDGLIFLGYWSVPVTILWIVAVMNVVNLMDGLDGLAAGVASIVALTLLVVSLRHDQPLTALFTAVLAGSALGFLPHNFNPAKIFMGDAGAMFLGFALAVVAIGGPLKQATTIALAVPVIALGLPIVDTTCAIVRRVSNGRPFHQADRGHLHHRLLRLGLSQRQAVVVLYGVSAWLGLNAIIVSEVPRRQGAGLLLLVIGLLLYAAIRVGALDESADGREYGG